MQVIFAASLFILVLLNLSTSVLFQFCIDEIILHYLGLCASKISFLMPLNFSEIFPLNKRLVSTILCCNSTCQIPSFIFICLFSL